MKQKNETEKRNSFTKYLLTFLLISAITITASCGSGVGNSDGGNSGGGPAPLATGTFTKTVDAGSPTYTGLLDTDPYAHFQYLYLASNINGAGRIAGLAIKYMSTVGTAVTCPNATINLSHSNLANLTNTFASNLGTGQGGQTTVLNNATMTFPAGAAGSWQTISLATPFDYNGKDNLIIDVERTSACSGIVYDAVNTSWPYTAGVWTTTNGSATGLTATWAANGRLVFAGGDDAVIPTAGAVSGNLIPFNNNVLMGRKVQLLYPSSVINGSGPITGIGMIVDTTTAAQEYTMTMRMGHSTLTNLTTTYNNNFSDAPVTVANGVVFKVPAGVPAGETVWFPLPGAFTYNGTNNLIVEIDVTNNSSANGDIYWRQSSPFGSNVRVYGDTGGVAGSVDQMGYHIKVRFNGGTMNILNGGTDGEAAYFDSSNNGRAQYLLFASELGTSGNITSFACRANNPNASALNYTNTVVILAHTTNKSLSATFASNVAGSVTVFSGTYTMPGNILEGDYFKIPFSTPFAYNGRDNLVVSIQSNADVAGITGVNCKLSSDATRFSDQRVGATNYANVAGSLTNHKPNVSIAYSK